jgi:lysophospholipase L1-like esterase
MDNSPGSVHEPPSPPPPADPHARRRVSWRHALLAGLICFAVWLTLDAPTLLHSSQASPIGTRRTVAMAVLRPIDRMSTDLRLSDVVGAFDRVTGQTGSGVVKVEPLRQPRAGQGGGRRFGARPGTAVTVPGGLPVLAAPSAGAPLRVLSVGDSLGIDFGDALVNDLAATGVVHAVLDAHVDTGLSRPDYFDWPLELSNDLVEDRPQLVVVFLGANDPQNIVSNGTALTFGTTAWDDAYAARVGAFMRAATDAGARVLWVGMPPMADPGLSAAMQALNRIYESQAATHPGVHYFASWPVLSNPQGGFAYFLPDAAGNVVTVREPDGTHIAPDGAELLSRAVISDMDRLWNLDLQP